MVVGIGKRARISAAVGAYADSPVAILTRGRSSPGSSSVVTLLRLPSIEPGERVLKPLRVAHETPSRTFKVNGMHHPT